MKRKLITIIITLIVVISASIGSVTAWMTYMKESASNINITLDAPEDTLELQGLYIGNDFDKNGELDDYFDNNIKQNINDYTKSEILKHYYTRYSEDDTNIASLPSGSVLTYRIILKKKDNSPANNFIINAFFTNLSSDSQYIRLMFEIFDIDVYEYSKSSYENITFGEILNNEKTSPLRKHRYSNEESTNFWELSNIDYFLGDGLFYDSSNSYLEIDFKIRTIDSSKTNQYFNRYYLALKENIGQIIADGNTILNDYYTCIDNLSDPSRNGDELYQSLVELIGSDDTVIKEGYLEKRELLLYYLKDLNHLYNSIYRILKSENNEISGELNFDIYITVTPIN